jgi:hypothetical protein
MRIIGLSGHAGAGKTETAQRLSRVLETQLDCGPWELVAFAAPVKKYAAGIMGVSLDFIDEWKRKPEPPPMWDKSVRNLLQFIGNGFRKFDQEVWVRKLAASLKPGGNYIIHDLRYPNEARWIRSQGGLLVRVWRPEADNLVMDCESETSFDSWDTELRSTHPKGGEVNISKLSSLDKPSFDYVIINDGSTLQLQKKVEGPLSSYVAKRLKYFVCPGIKP